MAHHEEIEHYKDIPLDPDFDSYIEAQKRGSLRVFTVRGDGALHGYSVFFVRRCMHSQRSLQAAQDLLYLRPSLRGQGVGRQFIRWCDEMMRAEGIQVVYQHLKARHNHGPLLEAMGYELMDLIYARRLS